MTINKQAQEKRDLILIDFDKTLFYNSFNNFSLNIPLDDIIDAHTFFSEFMYQTGILVSKRTKFILVTGRSESAKNLIIPYLQLKGYRFAEHYFNQMSSTSELDESTFMIKYWTAKAKLINQLKLSNEYKSVVVIDDDQVICSMLAKINIKVYRAEITKDILTQTLSVAFHHPQNLLMSELQAILKPHQEQMEQVADTV